MEASSAAFAPDKIWSPTESLPARLRALRDHYFSFYDRDFKNEVIPYTTGVKWDEVYTYHNWTVAPEVIPFQPAFRDSLKAAAIRVELPDGFWDEPLVVRRALFFRAAVETKLPVQILDGELIAGGQFNTALSRCLNRSETEKWKRLEEKFFKRAKAVDECGMGNCGAIPGHLIPDYPKILRVGFAGVVEECEAALEGRPSADKRDMLRAMIECAHAARAIAERYADEADRLAAEETDAQRKRELEQMAERCRHAPWNPARNFAEALQSLWLTHMLVMTAESYPGPGVSHGRIDQYMWPLYKKDIESGALDRESAFELIGSFFIKHNYAYDYQGRVGSNQGINSSFGQLITLGGHGPDGEDVSNDLTMIMLDAIEALNMLEPKPNVRLHAKTPRKLLDRLAEMIANAQGAPFLLNFDSASIRGLRWAGLPEERLWDYAPVGCLENTLQGDDRSGTVDININLAKAVELTLSRGRDTITGKQIGPRTPDPAEFAEFRDLWDAFAAQLQFMVDEFVDLYNLCDEIRARFEPTPYLSAIVGGCAESGKDVTQGGPRFNFITIEGIGLATAADSLMALKRLVFDEGRIGMKEVLAAIKDNFEGHEALRQTLLNRAPKFGNDDAEADDMARRVSVLWTEPLLQRTSPATGRKYRAGYLSWNYWIAYAPRTGATPDGRRQGEALSNGVCCGDGRDSRGPTALINSVANLRLETVPNGASHTVSFSPSLVADGERRDKFAALLMAYERAGGTALQVNVIDPETLIRAQKEPAKYRNLLVRVTGYNAYFATLGKEIQDEIIRRESHGHS